MSHALRDDMLAQELRDRLIAYSRLVARELDPLLSHLTAGHAARQALRASSSAAATYRAACLARSHAEFKSKIGLAVEESDESVFWLEYLHLTEMGTAEELNVLIAEGRELAAILGSSKRTSARNAHRYDRNLK